MTPPLVSVVIATRDRPEMVREAIAAALGQDYPGPLEVVVVFDQSEPDATLLGRDRVLLVAAVLAMVDVVLLTVLATLFAFLYNLCASFTGGFEVTLAEKE